MCYSWSPIRLKRVCYCCLSIFTTGAQRKKKLCSQETSILDKCRINDAKSRVVIVTILRVIALSSMPGYVSVQEN